MKRCRLCPYRKHCRDVCYGDAPCDFARAFDSLDRKLKWWQAKAKAAEVAAKTTPEQRIFGDYVFSPVRNAFNSKTSWWISKKGYAVARYCFTANTDAEVELQLQSADSYIEMFEEGLK
jgi:hypothetical protein